MTVACMYLSVLRLFNIHLWMRSTSQLYDIYYNCTFYFCVDIRVDVFVHFPVCECVRLCVCNLTCPGCVDVSWMLEDYVYSTFLAGELTHGDRCSPLAHNPCSNYPTLAGTVQYCTEDINIYDCIKFSNHHHHNYHHHHIVIVDFFKSFFGINVLLTRSCIDVVGDESQSVNSPKFMCCI